MNLKPYYDAVQAANGEVKKVAQAIDAAFTLGTEEGTLNAMELRPMLDDAQTKAEAAGKLYESMKSASMVNADGSAAKFVATPGAAEAEKKAMPRAEFDAMDAIERGKYIRNGGKVVDPAE